MGRRGADRLDSEPVRGGAADSSGGDPGCGMSLVRSGRPAGTPRLRDGEPAYRAPSRRRRITTDHGMTRPTILVGRPTVLRTEPPSRMSRPASAVRPPG